MNAVDTNVLIYVHDSRDPVKQTTAEALVRTLPDGVLLWQVACEYIAASRKLEPFGYSRAQAWEGTRKLQLLWKPQLPSWSVFFRAEVLIQRYSLSTWDSLLIAACLEAGVTRLYTEDFDDSVRAEGLEFVNPFATP